MKTGCRRLGLSRKREGSSRSLVMMFTFVVPKFAALLKSEYIEKGKLGVATGEGFYKYN